MYYLIEKATTEQGVSSLLLESTSRRVKSSDFPLPLKLGKTDLIAGVSRGQ